MITDLQLKRLMVAAGELAGRIPGDTPVKILKYQARRLVNLPEQDALFKESDLVMLFATVYPLIYCLLKIMSFDQIRFIIATMEKGMEKANENDRNLQSGNSKGDEKPN